jgi:indole-3-glycerol phosphate synthase
MPATLNQILAATRQSLIQAKAAVRLEDLERRAEGHKPRGFRHALETRNRSGLAIIAELKKASPSRGLIRQDFHPEQLAQELAEAGANALSVLTDQEFFQGSLENLERASSAVKLPCLRKDFIVDEFQIVEARANAADAILLIVAALSQNELISLMKTAREWQLDVLCEVHDKAELSRAADTGADLIGVNSRDLRTFKVDLKTALELGELISKPAVRVAESGIHSGEDIARLQGAGYQAFLIGESLMKAPHPGEALKALLNSVSVSRDSDRLPVSRP